MSDISLLPEELRKKEETEKQPASKQAPDAVSDLKFYVPAEEGEDIEIIEVDEGEVEQVLANEPALAKVAYYVTNFFEDLKTKLVQPRAIPPPPKLPPQFFKPPVPPPKGEVPAPAPPGVPGKPKIAPFAQAPKRVRVIRRVRKPVRVSFVSDEQLRYMRIDVARRRFTLILTSVVFFVLLAGGYGILWYKLRASRDGLAQVNARVATAQNGITAQLDAWSNFKNLEPKLKVLATLLNSHVHVSRFLSSIEAATLPSVYYRSLSLSADGKANMFVVADSLDSAAGQVTALQMSPVVGSVDATTYTMTYDETLGTLKSVEFQVGLALSGSAFGAQTTSTAAK